MRHRKGREEERRGGGEKIRDAVENTFKKTSITTYSYSIVLRIDIVKIGSQ